MFECWSFVFEQFKIEFLTCSDDCLDHCQKDPECTWFSHDSSTSICVLMIDCNALDDTCQTCISGEHRCKSSQEGWLCVI
jgi:hypothetical protein